MYIPGGIPIIDFAIDIAPSANIFLDKALSRKIFADGAISIAKSMIGIPPGMYTTQDFFR